MPTSEPDVVAVLLGEDDSGGLPVEGELIGGVLEIRFEQDKREAIAAAGAQARSAGATLDRGLEHGPATAA